MTRKRVLTFACWLLCCCLLVVGCSQTRTPNSVSNSSPTAQAISLTISAAASFKDSLETLKPIYAKEKPNLKLVYNFGSSGALQQQIEQGAKVDLFISAATKQMDGLEKKGLLIDGSRKNLLSNQMVLITPQNSTAVSDIKDLTSSRIKRIALGEPKSVPAGQYAQQVLTSLKIADKINNKVVYAKDVRQALNFVQSGNADAGLVYLSDAKNSPRVKIVTTLPESTHSPIVYPIAVLKISKNVDAAKEFEQFLFGDDAKTVFEKQGFTVAGR